MYKSKNTINTSLLTILIMVFFCVITISIVFFIEKRQSELLSKTAVQTYNKISNEEFKLYNSLNSSADYLKRKGFLQRRFEVFNCIEEEKILSVLTTNHIIEIYLQNDYSVADITHQIYRPSKPFLFKGKYYSIFQKVTNTIISFQKVEYEN